MGQYVGSTTRDREAYLTQAENDYKLRREKRNSQMQALAQAIQEKRNQGLLGEENVKFKVDQYGGILEKNDSDVSYQDLFKLDRMPLNNFGNGTNAKISMVQDDTQKLNEDTKWAEDSFANDEKRKQQITDYFLDEKNRIQNNEPMAMGKSTIATGADATKQQLEDAGKTAEILKKAKEQAGLPPDVKGPLDDVAKEAYAKLATDSNNLDPNGNLVDKNSAAILTKPNNLEDAKKLWGILQAKGYDVGTLNNASMKDWGKKSNAALGQLNADLASGTKTLTGEEINALTDSNLLTNKEVTGEIPATTTPENKTATFTDAKGNTSTITTNADNASQKLQEQQKIDTKGATSQKFDVETTAGKLKRDYKMIYDLETQTDPLMLDPIGYDPLNLMSNAMMANVNQFQPHTETAKIYSDLAAKAIEYRTKFNEAMAKRGTSVERKEISLGSLDYTQPGINFMTGAQVPSGATIYMGNDTFSNINTNKPSSGNGSNQKEQDTSGLLGDEDFDFKKAGGKVIENSARDVKADKFWQAIGGGKPPKGTGMEYISQILKDRKEPHKGEWLADYPGVYQITLTGKDAEAVVQYKYKKKNGEYYIETNVLKGSTQVGLTKLGFGTDVQTNRYQARSSEDIRNDENEIKKQQDIWNIYTSYKPTIRNWNTNQKRELDDAILVQLEASYSNAIRNAKSAAEAKTISTMFMNKLQDKVNYIKEQQNN